MSNKALREAVQRAKFHVEAAERELETDLLRVEYHLRYASHSIETARTKVVDVIMKLDESDLPK